MTKDTNQASEDELELIVARISAGIGGFGKLTCGTRYDGISEEAGTELLKAYIRTEKLKLLNEVIHQSTANLKSAKAVAGWAELRKEQLEANQ